MQPFKLKLVMLMSLHCALLPWQQSAAYIHRPQNIQQTNCRHILNSNLAATSQDDKKGVVLKQLKRSNIEAIVINHVFVIQKLKTRDSPAV